MNMQPIRSKEMILFFRQWALLLAAGISIVHACDILANQQAKGTLRHFIFSLKTNLSLGKNIVTSLQPFAKYFNSLTLHLIAIGEQTGKLDSMLQRIALYLEKSLSLKQKIIHALIYPCLVVTIAIAMSLLMIIAVIPRFAALFSTLHRPVPTLTQHVIDLSYCIRHDYGYIIILIIAIFLFFHYYLSNQPWRQYLLHIPYVSTVIKKNFFAQMSASLAITVSSGIPITTGLKMTATLSKQPLFQRAMEKMHYAISEGQSLHTAMQKNALFPDIFIQMIKVGEETGQLEYLFEQTAALYEAEVDESLKKLHTFFEPCVLLILGIIIGSLVIAMYLPLLTF